MDDDRNRRLSNLVKKKSLQLVAKSKPETTAGLPPVKTRSFVDPKHLLQYLLPLVLVLLGGQLHVYYKVGLWIIAGWISLHAITTEEVLKRPLTGAKRWSLILFVPLVVAVLFSSVIINVRQNEHMNTTTGTLTPENKWITQSGDTPELVLEVGDGGTYMHAPNLEEGITLHSDNDYANVRKKNGKILFSFTAKDDSGRTIVQVTDNDWDVASERSVCWDKNYNDHALEVLDARRKVILQVHLYKNGVRFQSLWDRGREVFEDGREDPVNGIAPLFKFPSKKLWGEFSGTYREVPTF